MSNVKADGLADLIAKYMNNYSQDVTDRIKAAVDIVAKEVNTEIKAHITFKQPTGDYVKAFRIKTSYEDKCNKGKIWYVSGGEYRLTHLLENGHAKKGGGRTDAFPHIIFGESLAQKRMEELSREAIENAK